MKKNLSLISLLTIIFSVCTFFFGMYYNFCHFAITALLGGILLGFSIKNKKLRFELTTGMLLFLVFLFGFIISLISAVDSGAAFLEAGRIIWPGLFLILYQQTEEDTRDRLFNIIPYLGVAETVFGFIVYLIPKARDYFWPDSRLGGFFQYPNTLALFLLIGIILILYKKHSRTDFILFILLMLGIAATGSRTVLVMTVPAVLIISVLQKKKIYFATTLLLIVFGVVFVFVTGNTATLGRLLKISLSSSSLNGRLLYAYDALPVMLKHPFGTGASGFYYLQNEIQTGLYSVRYIHNDLLQIGLDIGWIPMLFYLYAVVRTVLDKSISSAKRWILIVIFLHGLMDFDQAYSVITCIIFVILNNRKLSIKAVGKKKKAASVQTFRIIAGICTALGLYLFIPTFAGYCGNYRLSVNLYPYDTEAKLQLLSAATDFEEAEALADSILAQNKTCSLAYYTKAYVAYFNLRIDEMIVMQRKAIRYSYLDREYYLRFLEMLYNSFTFCDSSQLQNKCKSELISIPDMMKQAKSRLSSLGLNIKDQPDLDPGEELLSFIAEIKQMY